MTYKEQQVAEKRKQWDDVEAQMNEYISANPTADLTPMIHDIIKVSRANAIEFTECQCDYIEALREANHLREQILKLKAENFMYLERYNRLFINGIRSSDA